MIYRGLDYLSDRSKNETNLEGSDRLKKGKEAIFDELAGRQRC